MSWLVTGVSSERDSLQMGLKCANSYKRLHEGLLGDWLMGLQKFDGPLPLEE